MARGDGDTQGGTLHLLPACRALPVSCPPPQCKGCHPTYTHTHIPLKTQLAAPSPDPSAIFTPELIIPPQHQLRALPPLCCCLPRDPTAGGARRSVQTKHPPARGKPNILLIGAMPPKKDKASSGLQSRRLPKGLPARGAREGPRKRGTPQPSRVHPCTSLPGAAGRAQRWQQVCSAGQRGEAGGTH